MKKYLEVDPRIRSRPKVSPTVVVRVNGFTESSLARFSQAFSRAHESGQPVIPVVIDSYGGGIDALVGMIHEIQASSIPVATVVESKAMSAGAVLFSFGSPGRRYMAPHARLMIHAVSSMTAGDVHDIKADAAEADRLNQMIFHMMAKNCGREENYFIRKLHDRDNADWFLTARDAKRHGLCDHIHIPTLRTRVQVSTDFS